MPLDSTLANPVMTADTLLSNISFLWNIILYIAGLVFLIVVVRRFNMVVFHTQRTSITTQKLLEELKETKKEVAEIKSLLAPHYIDPTQVRSTNEGLPPDEMSSE